MNKKEYYLINRERIRARQKEYCLKNKEKRKQYLLDNKEKISEKHREYRLNNREKIKEKERQYQLKNREKIKEYHNNYDKNRKKIDINYKLVHALRRRLNNALKNKQKIGSAVSDLGCSVDCLKLHLEKQFVSEMTWDNYGKWHIDHIIPLSLFNLQDKNDFLKANHYSNLQPMWAKDNIIKGNKYNE